MKSIKSRRVTFTIIGFLLGMIFPLMVFVTVHFHDGGFSSIEQIEPQDIYLMVEISSIPFFLGGAGYLIGRSEEHLVRVTEQMREIIFEREHAISQEHFYFSALMQNSPLAVVQLDAHHRVVSLNPKFEDLFGYQEEEIIGKNLDQLLTNDDILPDAISISQKVISGDFVHVTTQRLTKNGQLVDVDVFGIPVIVSGEKIGVLGLYQDISWQKDAERNIRKSQERYKALFQNSPISLWQEDFSRVKEMLAQISFESEQEMRVYFQEHPDFFTACIQAIQIVDVNRATMVLYGAKDIEELGGLWKVAEDLSNDVFVEELIALQFGHKFFSSEIEQRNLNGELFHANLFLSVVPGYEETWERVIVSIMDITATKDLENKLRYMSFHDSLTGLYNRAYFDQELTRYNGGRMYPMVIAVCDLDNLKRINDTKGHSVGDQAIRTAGLLLAQSARVEDMVARIGGDEFGMIFPQTGERGAESILQRIQKQIETHNAEKREDDLYRPISLSVGMVVVDQQTTMFEGFKTADEKMYENKRRKKSTH